MNYGFLIDNRSCIGCHACSTACKSENEVPLGVYRTWVKQVEHGAFGEARRHFQVTRCNHCAKPPCVAICPVTAMYKRPDGIVEFDGDVCIGCKACLQACPYDAIYIDPETHTAAKCHFCAHRTDLGLEPACVVVCPTQAIVAGDLDDPDSRIRHLLAEHPTSVRRPEQGTAPKLFYIDAHEVTLNPLAAPAPGNMAFTSLIDERAGMRVDPRERARPAASAEAPDWQSAGPMVAGLTRLTYNAQHKAPWHWQVPAYLVTKGIASGMFMFMAAIWLLGVVPFNRQTALVGNGLVLIFLAITTVLLVADLERPERFLRILTRPQWKSWLTRGAFILIGFSLVCTAWFAVELGAQLGWLAESVAEAARVPLMAIGFPLALMTAIYTAFLFQQCEGRDLWQSRLMPWHMGVQAVMAGGATLLLLQQLQLQGQLPPPWGHPVPSIVWSTFFLAGALDLALRWTEVTMRHNTSNGSQAAWILRNGPERRRWRGSMLIGGFAVLAPVTYGAIALKWYYGQRASLGDHFDLVASTKLDTQLGTLMSTWLSLLSLAAILALVGLFLYESAIIKAGQDVPNA
ncbi:MAG: polysulfide reductase NrfD [Ardenticatenia bacterium]|nr:polysulfide reductase NrfD [Ardenticatenia bacterium]